MFTDQAPQQLDRPLHRVVQAEHLRLQDLAPAKRQQLAGERRRMIGGRADLLDLRRTRPTACHV